MIIHINGWPGVGKSTIGGILSEQIGARFIHNHVLHDVSLVCAGIGDEDRWPLYEKIRSAAYDVLERRPSDEIFVMTNALCKTADREVKAWNHVVSLAIHRKVPLVPIILTASAEELAKRIVDPNRLQTKLKNPLALIEMVSKHALQVPNVMETLVLDVGNWSAQESAAEISRYVSSNAGSWTIATEESLQFE